MSETPSTTEPRSGRGRAGALALACALVMAVSPGASARAPQDDERDEFRPRAFQLYDTQAARARAAEAEEHIATGRWSEALAELQALMEEHRGEVLGAARPTALGARQPSQADVHSGAGSWAVQQLFALPEEARTLYRERFGRRAGQALERAIAAADRGALARVAQRWPLTTAAERAWWALGDLEIELGHDGDGLRAWARAAALRVGEPLRVTTTEEDWKALRKALAESEDGAKGALARTELALALLPELDGENGSRPRAEASFARGPASGIAAASITSSHFRGDEGTAGWPSPFRLPDTPYSNANGASRLFPQRVGEVVLINTSRSVHALDAFDGTEIWSLQPDQLGWRGSTRSRSQSDFDDAVDVTERIVTVAASRGIVVAPVQIPWSFEGSDVYNELSIIEVIPERRLVALDVETGESIWNTLPPYDWDGDSGTFAERMTVVGPPTIVGARVLVPMARLRGRIEFHLGCFDLTTGDVLWSAPIVTGQRTLNMFGRANVEFSAPPPVVSGDTVIVATQLGLVAAIDLFTGETRWDTLYDQVTILPPQYYTAGSINNKWRNAPPIVVDDTVVVAPFDGKQLFALDAETGAMIWSIEQKSLLKQVGIERTWSRPGPQGGLEVLLGADERRVLLGGTSVAAIEFTRGLRAGPPYARAWVWPLDRSLRSNGGFPAIDADSIFVPDAKGVAVIDRETGNVREEIVGQSVGGGHLLIADGMLFSTNGSSVDARFEWAAMVARARLAVEADGASSSDLDMLVRLLLERAESLLDRGADVARALKLTQEAETAIADFAPARPGGDRTAIVSGNDLARRKYQQHRALMLRVRGERLRGDADAARRAARGALELKASRAQSLEALLALHEIERSRDAAARAQILATLLERHAESTVEVEARVSASRWSASRAESAVLKSVRESGGGRTRLLEETLWTDPWSGPIVPLAATLGPANEAGQGSIDARTATITVGMFALLGQIEMARLLSDVEDSVAGELMGLHAILREVPSENLFGTLSGDWAAARVRALRALQPRSAALAEIDVEAQAMLERARTAAKAGGSTTLLEKLPALFPGSAAARSAAEARIEFALESGSPREVAAIVGESLSPDWHPARSPERETVLLLRLAETLGEAGNAELKAGIASNLARYRPNLEVDLPGTGNIRLDALRDRWTAEPAPRPRSVAEFDNRVLVSKSTEGDYAPVGRALIADTDGSPPQEALLAASRNMLVALTSGRSGAPVWRRPTDLGVVTSARADRVLVGRDSIVLAERENVTCVESGTGLERWTFASPGRTIAQAVLADGVVVVVTSRSDTREPAEVHGLDAALGIELWRLGSIRTMYHTLVKAGDGRFVLLPVRGTEAAVHDLYTGHPVATAATGKLNLREAQTAWLDRGNLVLASIDGGYSDAEKNSIVAYDLDNGRESWRVDLDQHAGAIHNLAGLIEMPSGVEGSGVVRLAMLERVDPDAPRGGGLRQSERALHVLDEGLGALNRRALVTLDAATHLVGVNIRRRVVVESPILIAIQQGEDETPPLLQAIDPRRGVIWRQVAARKILATGSETLAPPVVGDGVIAMLVRQPFGRSRSNQSEMRLMFLDGATGRQVELRTLESGARTARWRDLKGVGGSLVVMGGQQMDVLE